MKRKRLKKVQDFLFGISASSYHIEGGNYNSDWHEFEQVLFKDTPEHMCGTSIDYWNRWQEDHELLSELGIHMYRTSIEWSRIHIAPDTFDEQALEQYYQMFLDLKKRNIKVVLTLFHYVSPTWFKNLGGFEKKSNIKHFEAFSRKVLEKFHDVVEIVTPINEIFIYSGLSYLVGYWTPQYSDLPKFIRVTRNLIRSHYKVLEIIEENGYDIKVSSAEHTRLLKYNHNNWIVSQIEKLTNYLFNHAVVSSLNHNRFALPFGLWGRVNRKVKAKTDYNGIQFYPSIHIKIHIQGWMPRIAPANENLEWPQALLSAELNPKDMKEALKSYKSYGKELIITETGIQTDDDEIRELKLKENIQELYNVISEGIPIKGYMYFTLHDCFEWAEGHRPKFGLVHIDRENNLQRIKKKSFEVYKNLISKFKPKTLIIKQ